MEPNALPPPHEEPIEPKPEIKNSPSQVRLPFFIGITLACGLLLGATMFGGSQQVKDLLNGHAKLKQILTYIDRDYVDTVNTEQLVDYSITKMLEKLDPHTSYIPVKDVQMANAQLEGDFEGIGIEFNIYRDTLVVVATIPGGPSETAGLRAGDKIVAVDGQSISGHTLDNATVYRYLRGKKGSKVTLDIRRKGRSEIFKVIVTRGKIPSYSVDVSYMIDAQTGYIKVSRFSANTYKEFRDALSKLKKQGMTRLMLDLRDNPGGYLDRAVDMADELIPGNAKIVYTKGKNSKYDVESRAHIKGLFESGAIVVLINEGSASASEIMAGALQDNDRALIVGRRSFGKGLVQVPMELNDGSELRLTISRYYTPSGRSIQKPYQNDPDGSQYKNDLRERYNHGELFTADSIKFDPGLQYTTKAGRTVYGGGGIMPDVFVPLDTTQDTRLLNQLYEFNIIRAYALSYYEDHQQALSTQTYSAYYEGFVVNEKMHQALQKMALDAGIKIDAGEYRQSQTLIAQHLKAWIARSVWKEEGFFPIWLERDEIFKKALTLFEEAARIGQ